MGTPAATRVVTKVVRIVRLFQTNSSVSDSLNLVTMLIGSRLNLITRHFRVMAM